MGTYKSRMMPEYLALNTKISKLLDFTQTVQFDALNKDAQDRLRTQIGFMLEYSLVLATRIFYD